MRHKGRPHPLRYARSKNIPRKVCGTAGPSAALRSGRDDKGSVTAPFRVDAGPRCFSLPLGGRRPMTPSAKKILTKGPPVFLKGTAFRPYIEQSRGTGFKSLRAA